MGTQQTSPPSLAKPLGTLDSPDSRVPAYLHIAQTLSERVATGFYPEGGILPSGTRLCEEFGVCPMTVRRALTMLEDRGIVVGKKGKGTFARSLGLSDSAFRLDLLAGDWLDHSSEIRLLSASMIEADDKVARILGVAPGEFVVLLRRLVLKNGSPAMYHREYIVYDPRRPLVESQLHLTSMDAFLESGEARRFPRGELTLTAAGLDAESAEALQEPEGTMALRLEAVLQESDGTPVSWGWFLIKAQVFQLKTRLGSGPAGSGSNDQP
jgi:GntR family transcriptional regulator